jgi:hypothetical protein
VGRRAYESVLGWTVRACLYGVILRPVRRAVRQALPNAVA